MLPFNRIYTPQELRAASRLGPTTRQAPIEAGETTGRRAGLSRGRALLALGQRLFGRTGLGHEAPSTT